MSKLKDFRVWLAIKILGSIGLAYNLKFAKEVELKTGSKNFSIVNCYFDHSGIESGVGLEKINIDEITNK